MSGGGPKEPAIGVFDSGVGGLTVFRRIAEALPREHLCYLGDTARVPYGTKSADTVIRYARSCAAHLRARGIKMLVVACNTASAYALEVLRDELPLPVIGVVEPGARAAIARTKTGRVGVIGTPGTVASGAYVRAIAALSPDIRVYSQACPLFVPLVEDGWTTGPVPEAVASRYLDRLAARGVDTLVLGCTHYPLLRGVIAKAMGPKVCLVDSAKETAKAVVETLQDRAMLQTGTRPGRREFYASDAPESFAKVGARMLGPRTPLAQVEWVDV
ncbi:MAG: glutamate racemase [Candidatus Hydrogenedentes bacterium]|nr:glutamate racemase [Candidatus Hydrogenedentota bacterium]